MLDNFISIWYSHGMRGNAIYRILAAHPEVYWNTDNKLISSLNPLNIPSNVTSIENLAYGNSIATKIGIWKMGYTTYHSCSLFTQTCFTQVMYSWAHNRNKILFCLVNPIVKNNDGIYIVRYPTYKELGVSAKQYKLIDPSNPHIWVYGTRDRLNMPKTYFSPSTNPLAYNLNVDALFSKDYVTFETEYYKLIAHFNLTSCLNDIRAFILLVLEREEYIRKFWYYAR
jgi:hypothetical protein